MSKDGEPTKCNIDLTLKDDSDETIDKVKALITMLKVPKGSCPTVFGKQEGDIRDFELGTLEGMGIYLNGTDLPRQVYESCDINYVIEQINKAVGQKGKLRGWWHGPKETALYYYGESFEDMKNAALPFLSEYPLCEKCRVEKIV